MTYNELLSFCTIHAESIYLINPQDSRKPLTLAELPYTEFIAYVEDWHKYGYVPKTTKDGRRSWAASCNTTVYYCLPPIKN